MINPYLNLEVADFDALETEYEEMAQKGFALQWGSLVILAQEMEVFEFALCLYS